AAEGAVLFGDGSGHAFDKIGDQQRTDHEIQPHPHQVQIGAVAGLRRDAVVQCRVRGQGGKGKLPEQQCRITGQTDQPDQPGEGGGQGDGGDGDGYQQVGNKGVGGTPGVVHQQAENRDIHQQMAKKFPLGDGDGAVAAPPGKAQDHYRQGKQGGNG